MSLKKLYCFLSLFLITACVSNVSNNYDKQQEKQYLEDQAITYLNNNQTDEAISIYKSLADNYPDDLILQIRYAEILRKNRDYKASADIYANIINNPNAADDQLIEAFEGASISYMQIGNIDKVLEILPKILEKDASRWKVINSAATAYALLGKYDNAFEYYDMALAFAPDNPIILNNLALSYALKRDYKQSITNLDKALKGNISVENKRKLEMNQALIYSLNGNDDKAKKILMKYLTNVEVEEQLSFYRQLAQNKLGSKEYIENTLKSGSKVKN